MEGLNIDTILIYKKVNFLENINWEAWFLTVSKSFCIRTQFENFV